MVQWLQEITNMNELLNKKAFLEHQKRDLPACHPSEREGRILEIQQLEKEIEEMENAEASEEVLEEAILDLISNIADIKVTIQNEYDRCPHGYAEGYVQTFAKIVSVLTEENIRKLLQENK
jgi:hypothetical protein